MRPIMLLNVSSQAPSSNKVSCGLDAQKQMETDGEREGGNLVVAPQSCA